MKTPKTHSTLTLAALGLAFAAGGCSLLPGGGGGGDAGPDEFRVVTKAPLSVPPEYSLRPPRAGSSVPREADTSRETTVTAFGTNIGADASPVANATDPRIRAIVDYEEGRLVRKTSEDADQILSSTPDGAVADSATGDAEVSIARGSGDRIKLPGT